MQKIVSTDGSLTIIKPDDGTKTLRGRLETAPEGYEIVSYHSERGWTPDLQQKTFHSTRIRRNIGR